MSGHHCCSHRYEYLELLYHSSSDNGSRVRAPHRPVVGDGSLWSSAVVSREGVREGQRLEDLIGKERVIVRPEGDTHSRSGALGQAL